MKIPFASSERSSLGIEWELQLVDPLTRELVSGAVEILNEVRPVGAEEHPKIKHEMLQCMVEIVTGVCQTVSEARADLDETLRVVAAAAQRRGIGLMGGGTHPTADWTEQLVSPPARYQALKTRLPWLHTRMLVFGVHVHVGVRSPEKVIPIINALTGYIPYFIALSASSPFWKGNDTGLSSARTRVFEALPNSGMPYRLDTWNQFEDVMGTLIRTDSIESIKDMYWDIRPHPTYGTVELRICDGLANLDDVTTVAALAQCLVERYDSELDRGVAPAGPAPWMIRENRWRAIRDGLAADIIVSDDGTVVPIRRALLDLVGELTPIARRLGCAEELTGVERILLEGTSSERQRAVYEASGGDFTKVVDSLLAEMATGLSSDRPLAEDVA